MRRSELLGLRWTDFDLDKHTVSINRGLVAIGYELHESRGKTANRCRCVDLDQATVDVVAAWRQWTQLEHAVTGEASVHVFTTGDSQPVHPHSISQAFERISRNAGLPVIRFNDLRHTHATLLIKEGVPVKVVSERLGHATTAFTIETNTSCPACKPTPAFSVSSSTLLPTTPGGRPSRTRPENARRPGQHQS